MTWLFNAFARLKRRVALLEERVDTMAKNEADLTDEISRVAADEAALEARVKSAQAALQTQIDALKSGQAPDQSEHIAALEAIRASLAGVDPDPAPAPAPAPEPVPAPAA